jgi:hypothetical protein
MVNKLSFGLVAVVVVFTTLGGLFAQTPDCEQCYCKADNTPGGTGCAAGGDCVSYTFTAECTQQYTLKYSLTCSGESSCSECFACVYLTDENSNVVGVAHSGCTVNDCIGEGDRPTLTANEEYTLWVCLRSCNFPNTSDCTDCVARGYVYHEWSDCSTISACNP